MEHVSVVDTEAFTQEKLRELIAHYIEPGRIPKMIKVITDTSDFFRVEYDNVLLLEGHPYFIRNYEREGRFGIDEQPKFWVKRAIDLTDGSMKIIKMVFHEEFRTTIGDLSFDCYRSSKKEARILTVVKNHSNFMQGSAVTDSAGNLVRVIDYIPGKSMADSVQSLAESHEEYFHTHFPSVLDNFIELVHAIKFLHDREEKHGDIRRDHVLWDRQSSSYRWIDFDYNYLHKENIYGYDLFGLGNIIIFLAGCGDITVQHLRKYNEQAFNRIVENDLNIIFNNRVTNLRKIYPYIPYALNSLLLHFSLGAPVFYDETAQLLDDLGEVRSSLS